MSTFGISFKNNPEQLELVRLINENNIPIVVCTGDAGTGKTFASLVAALDLQSNRKYKNIIYGRNPMSLGEDMGFLPGDLDQKYGPYMGPLYDNLEAIARVKKGNDTPESLIKHVEMVPIAFMRGRSFTDTILIIDEAQNLDLITLKALLTRVGDYCKIILLGSLNQIDDPKQRRKEKSDFEQVVDKIKDLPYVRTIELTKSMRSPWCVEIDKLLREIKG